MSDSMSVFSTVFPVRPILLLGAILIAACAAATPLDPSIPTAQTKPFDKAMAFYRTYLKTVNLVDPAIVYRYSIGDPEGLQALLDDIAREQQAVERLALDRAEFAADYDARAFERLAIPHLLRDKLEQSTEVPEEDVRSMYQTYPNSYPNREMIHGWEIYVRDDARPDTATLTATLETLRKQLQTDQFPWVAVRYYWTVGSEYDGSLGMVYRGDIPDWKFDAFLAADPDARFFGPVRVKDGWLFGKLQEKFTHTEDPYAYYAERIRASLRPQRAKQNLVEFYKEQKNRLKPEVHRYDPASTLGLEQVAYRFGTEAVTFQEVLKRLPHLTGNPDDPRFYDAMTKHAFEDDLILHSPLAEEIRKSPAFAFLARAHRNAFLADRYVKSRMDTLVLDGKAIQKFYEDHAATDYAQPDLMRLLILFRQRTAQNDNDPLLRYTPKKPDFEAAHRLRTLYEAAPGPEKAKQLAQTDPQVRWEMHEKDMPEDQLGRILEIAVQDVKEGKIVGPVVGPRDYLVVHVLQRKKQPPTPMEQLQNRLQQDAMVKHKQMILKELYGENCAHPY